MSHSPCQLAVPLSLQQLGGQQHAYFTDANTKGGWTGTKVGSQGHVADGHEEENQSLWFPTMFGPSTAAFIGAGLTQADSAGWQPGAVLAHWCLYVALTAFRTAKACSSKQSPSLTPRLPVLAGGLCSPENQPGVYSHKSQCALQLLVESPWTSTGSEHQVPIFIYLDGYNLPSVEL